MPAIPGPESLPSRYGSVAQRYWEAGWQPLPLPPGAKFPPPSGYTGKTAYEKKLTPEQVADWAHRQRIGNIGLRMPFKVASIDVDDYAKGGSIKPGAETLAELIRQYGPLPPTVSSSARDGIGQLFYRIPDLGQPVILPGVLGPGIEAIQHHHRYSVVWPSQNPDAGDAVYRWRKPDPEHTGDDWWRHWAELQDEWFIPSVNDLPLLPEAWCHITPIDRKGGVERTPSEAPLGSKQILDALQGWQRESDEDPLLADQILNRYAKAVGRGEARHDSCMSALAWACKAGEAGLIDTVTVVDTLQSMFSADTNDRFVHGEFESMLGWAAAQGKADGAAYRAGWEAKRTEWRGSQQIDVWAGQETAAVIAIPEQAAPLVDPDDIPPFTGRTHRTVMDPVDGSHHSVATEEYKAYIERYYGGGQPLASAGEGVTNEPEPQKDDPTDCVDLFTGGGTFLLNVPEEVPAVWGRDDQVLWAEGEALIIAAPQGVGKTTIATQIVRARMGLQDSVLGFPVKQGNKKVLYLAMDRPRQFQRAANRLFKGDDEQYLNEHLAIWQGPPPFDFAKRTDILLAMCEKAGADTVVIDSIKDAAIGLSSDEVGAGYNRARQRVIKAGVEVLELHHNRKEGSGGGEPNTISDVYGSTWITSGAGSVIFLWGEAGDPIVRFRHLKQPVEEVGPFQVMHDHPNGVSSIQHSVDLLMLIKNSGPEGLTAAQAAREIFETTPKPPSPAQREKARRRLDDLVKGGGVTCLPGGVGKPSTYHLRALPGS